MENEITKYTVYCHTNKITGKKYIGITKLKPERRWSNGAGYKECVCFYNAILKYGWEEFYHEILFSNLTVDDAEYQERYLIKKYNTLAPNGYNLQSGGSVNRYFSEETRLKMSKSGKGKKMSEESKEKIRITNTGKKRTEETLIKMRNANLGKKLSAEHKQNIKLGLLNSKNRNFANKKIAQYDLNGIFIRNWESASIASRELKICRRSIGKCCTMEQSTSAGFIWRFI